MVFGVSVWVFVPETARSSWFANLSSALTFDSTTHVWACELLASSAPNALAGAPFSPWSLFEKVLLIR